ncbi:hypothetical protein BIY26_16470 [Brenneria goodwinii]|uniref:Phage protein n=1 Tax=Brenneria goodwinii TaxID=1109412 RepID=A0A0G4K1F4_9GAMM|nr:hypothetical protein [Brenneria goodwinii]ATA24218.1 hypothetical protein AWC36_08875 [Brenneria goodwinii]MCG8155138.1 hypothetical protein [Brenneria goodwinii]MCG8159382.1 hypothetical protein [Brenneria goodwinii]MCG8164449.1 hypothetical protein [Brenneria goodwinii]MCG8168985.1 hypothetical protein [Brenneria goodwinii]
MKTVKAMNMQEARQLLSAGRYQKVELAFDISSDEFFQVASEWCARGAKIKHENGNFVLKIKSVCHPSEK